MKIWNDLKHLFGRLTLLELASAELSEAERHKMEAHSSQEFATSIISYETARIKRLKSTINELSKEQKK